MTKTSTRIALAFLAVAAMGAAHAGMESIVVIALAAAALPSVDPTDRQAIGGTYQMADGRTLVLRSRGTQAMVAELDGVPSTVLRVQGTTLRSADKSMAMRFNRDGDTVITTVTLAVDGQVQTLASLAPAKR